MVTVCSYILIQFENIRIFTIFVPSSARFGIKCTNKSISTLIIIPRFSGSSFYFFFFKQTENVPAIRYVPNRVYVKHMKTEKKLCNFFFYYFQDVKYISSFYPFFSNDLPIIEATFRHYSFFYLRPFYSFDAQVRSVHTNYRLKNAGWKMLSACGRKKKSVVNEKRK